MASSEKNKAAGLYVVVPPSPLFAAHWSFFLPEAVEPESQDKHSSPTKSRRIHASGDRLHGFELEIVRGYEVSKHRSVGLRRNPVGLIRTCHLQQHPPNINPQAGHQAKDEDEGGGYVHHTATDDFEQVCTEVEAPGPSLRNASGAVGADGRVQKVEVRDCQWWVREVEKLLVGRGMLNPLPMRTGRETTTPTEMVDKLPPGSTSYADEAAMWGKLSCSASCRIDKNHKVAFESVGRAIFSAPPHSSFMPPGSLVQRARRRMDELVKRAIGAAEQQARPASSVAWTPNEPWKQPWHLYSASKRQWETQQRTTLQQHSKPIKRLALYSWNIDFMLPFPDSRMRTAIRHLEALVRRSEDEESTASVIFLQECVASDLALIAGDAWIQHTFAITDRSTENWQSGHYGTTTLIDKRLAIKDVFRVHYEKTCMQRDGLFVDIALPPTSNREEPQTIRLCNTHLESLALEPPLRPAQIALCANYMHADSISFAAAAGDFNAIQDFDKTLHSENDLQDAFLSRGGSEEDAEGGHTWGQQAATTQRERFGTSRMDKVFFGGGAMKCVEFGRFGAGIEVEAEDEREKLVGLGFDRPWITDHLGVKAVFEVV